MAVLNKSSHTQMFYFHKEQLAEFLVSASYFWYSLSHKPVVRYFFLNSLKATRGAEQSQSRMGDTVT